MMQNRKKILRRMRRRFHHAVEGVFVRLLGAVVPRLSRRGERRLAAVLGTLGFHVARGTRRIAMANLGIVYGDTKTRAEKLALAKASLIHTAQITLDYFWFSRDTAARLEKYCVCDDAVVNEWAGNTAPGFFVTAHLGNWEVGGNFVSGRGRKMSCVYRPIGSARTLDLLLKFRQSTGQQIIAKDGAGTGILRALRAGHVVALVLDQHTDLREGGIYLDFFGLPAAFSNICGIMANRMKIPVCVACSCHDAAADKYRIKTYISITAEDVAQMTPEQITSAIVACMEKMILDNPSQWLWSYRRWKRCPAGDDIRRFPFYAKREV